MLFRKPSTRVYKILSPTHKYDITPYIGHNTTARTARRAQPKGKTVTPFSTTIPTTPLCSYVPTPLCFYIYTPMFLHPYVPTTYVPTPLCSYNLCSYTPMFLHPYVPTPYVPTPLCSYTPMFLCPYIPSPLYSYTFYWISIG